MLNRYWPSMKGGPFLAEAAFSEFPTGNFNPASGPTRQIFGSSSPCRVGVSPHTCVGQFLPFRMIIVPYPQFCGGGRLLKHDPCRTLLVSTCPGVAQRRRNRPTDYQLRYHNPNSSVGRLASLPKGRAGPSLLRRPARNGSPFRLPACAKRATEGPVLPNHGRMILARRNPFPGRPSEPSRLKLR